MGKVRSTLARMDKPYEGIILILELVEAHNPRLSDLDALIAKARMDRMGGPYYKSGDEDILFFCTRQLGIIEQGEDDRFHLNGKGGKLHRLMYTPGFKTELFLALLEASMERFSYFHKVYESLEGYVRRFQTRLPRPVFDAIISETNRASGKEIRHLLLGCGAIKEEGQDVILQSEFFSMDAEEIQIGQLLTAIGDMLERDGRLLYPDTMTRLQALYPAIDVKALEPQLRSRLRVNSTRATEYIDGLR